MSVGCWLLEKSQRFWPSKRVLDKGSNQRHWRWQDADCTDKVDQDIDINALLAFLIYVPIALFYGQSSITRHINCPYYYDNELQSGWWVVSHMNLSVNYHFSLSKSAVRIEANCSEFMWSFALARVDHQPIRTVAARDREVETSLKRHCPENIPPIGIPLI